LFTIFFILLTGCLLFFLLKPQKEIMQDDKIVTDHSLKNKARRAADPVPVRAVNTLRAMDHHNEDVGNR
jgi:hypothetical protein